MKQIKRYFIAMYDEDDMPYMTFESYKECANFIGASKDTIMCNISRHQKKKYKGKYYMLHRIELNEDDIEIPKKCKNLHIGALLEVLNI